MCNRSLFRFGAHEVTPGFQWSSYCSIYSFLWSALQIIICQFSFGQGIVCSSLIYASDYPIGIFKMFLQSTNEYVVIIILAYTTEYE